MLCRTYAARSNRNVGPSDPIRVKQVAYYPGLFGLWHTAVRFPNIIEPPGATVP